MPPGTILKTLLKVLFEFLLTNSISCVSSLAKAFSLLHVDKETSTYFYFSSKVGKMVLLYFSFLFHVIKNESPRFLTA